ncbi:nucleotidyl transferase AbiEii/AbiGii toxin family protein [Geothrix alkalitolerans]|uniref:nucleotidyl transferase AbiEii/AbiGii toxin family protein n=1 Tax=Geothrix alkalitolerans TaxID=2922724 RepID=UPI001FAEC701|nr:nucleotidyl transferase AbiEii/AbiGii toxin family protein [Geothrix alkalitolerans]
MTTTWLDLKRPLDLRLDRLLRDLDDLFRSRGIDYLLTGGMAREILLYYGHGCATGRATKDVDFGVTLSSWEDYEALRSALVGTGTFRPDPKETQRMIHRDPGTGLETKVDLVPFGAIAGPDGALAWPPDGSHLMRVLGYPQALASAIHLRLDETRWVPLASGPGLACMKLVAWMDRGDARLGRDAVDFMELLHQYSHVLTDQELYDNHPEAMDRYDFRAEPAAAFILGKQVASLADDQLRKVISEALEPPSKQKMLNYFLREQSFKDSGNLFAEAAQQLDSFSEGWQF